MSDKEDNKEIKKDSKEFVSKEIVVKGESEEIKTETSLNVLPPPKFEPMETIDEAIENGSKIAGSVSDEPNQKPKPQRKRSSKIKGITYYNDGIELKLKNRRILLCVNKETGIMTLTLKRKLKKEDGITTFTPFSVEVLEKANVKVGITTLNLSQEAMECIIYAFSKMIEENIITKEST